MAIKKASITLVVLVSVVWASGQLYWFAAADMYASVGRNKLEAGDQSTAQEYLSTSLRYFPKDADNWRTYAESLYGAAKAAKTKAAALHLLTQAQKAYQKSTQLNPLEGNAWLGLGYTRWWLSKLKGFEHEYEEVEANLLRALATDPNNGEFLYAVASYYLSDGEIEKGLPKIERLASTFPNAYQHLKKATYWSDEVSDHFKNGLKLASLNRRIGRNALSVLASISADEEDFHSAASYAGDIINRFNKENSPTPYLSLGYYYLKVGSQEKAKAAFLQALRFSLERGRTLNNLLWPLRQANAFDIYLNLCVETSKFDKSVRNDLPLFLGKAYFYKNDLELAAKSFCRYLETQESAEAHFFLAEIAFRKKDWDTAEIESQKATVIDPDNSQYHYLFARSLQSQKKFDSALKAMNEAIRYADSPKHYYYNIRGWLHWSLGDYQAAVDDWEKGFEIAPDNANYPAQIAMAYKYLKNYVGAEHYYLVAIKLNPQNNRFRQELEFVRKSK